MLRALCALALLCGVCVRVRALSLADYHARVTQASEAADSLVALYDAAQDDEAAATTPSDAAVKLTEMQLLHELRARLPATEHVEWTGGAADVNNRWLQIELDALDRLPPTPIAPRLVVIRRIDERLHALNAQIDQAEHASVQPTPDKSVAKGRLHSILQRPEYNTESARGGALERLWDWLLKWLRSLMPERQPMQPGTALFISRLARGLVYALSIAVIVFVLWRYGPRLLRRPLTRSRAERARVVLGERLAPEQTAAALLTEAEQLARTGDLRGAMRKAYIAVLCALSERKILRLAPAKTNRDYLRALREHASILQSVQPLTLAYERHWYGLTPASEADWQEFQARSKAVTNEKP